MCVVLLLLFSLFLYFNQCLVPTLLWKSSIKLLYFRLYAVRKIRDTFQTNKTINDFELIDREIATAKQSLEMLRRQVSVGEKNLHITVR